jgi:signal transduction histidine kinase
MSRENRLFSPTSGRHSNERALLRRAPLLSAVVFLVLAIGAHTSAQEPLKKNVLILSDVGSSHPLTSKITGEIVDGVLEKPNRHVEFYYESLDLMAFPSRPSREEAQNWLAKKYGDHQLDVVVAVGPGAISFLSNDAEALFSEVPIVIAGSSRDEVTNPKLDSRFTGTWLKFEPEKTLEVALRLFPDTRRVFVVGGSSVFDEVGISLTKAGLSSFNTSAEIHYLTKMEMGELLEQLQHLPDHSIGLYVSFFQDAAGKNFLNATKALPMITAASNGPDFGVSDTYLGHGIVGGYVMTYGKQGNITAQIVSELLDGKKAQELPIETLPGEYMFDWNELQKWHIPESNLPPGSVILFRERGLWERTKWAWYGAFLIILGLSTLAAYLHHSRKQLRLAREGQRELSGLLINAEEQERRRVASELHDDFSQRVALVALRIDNVADAIPTSFEDAHQQLRKLVNSTSEIGADLHTLSHQLHSTTLENLGLVPAVGGLCKEFAAQQAIKIDFMSDDIPHLVSPNTALCVFRIVQEGLRNAKKHSGAEQVRVCLQRSGNRLTVSVRDEGRGFDMRDSHRKQGIGLRSMKERARLLSGEFKIQSVPGRGTTIEAWIPLASRENGAKDHAC